MRPAVFLDRDGTLITDQQFRFDPAAIRLRPGARAALRLLQQHGYTLVVVTNQSGVARGYFPEEAVRAFHAALDRRLRTAGLRIAGYFYCPHHPAGTVAAYRQDCACRKPRPGLLLQAARALDLDLGRSWMVGDIAADVLAGQAAGCRTALVTRRPGPELRTLATPPTVVARHLWAAARRILGQPLPDPSRRLRVKWR